MQWYVQVQNQAYGPYSDGQMQAFVSEGRVNEHSLISNGPNDGFYSAVGYDVFRLWAGTGQTLASVGGAAQPAYQSHAPYAPRAENPSAYQYHDQHEQNPGHGQSIPEPVTPVSDPYNGRPNTQPEPRENTDVFLIMAEIRSDGAMGFLKALQSFGTAQRIGDTVWLVRSASGVEQLRNTLSQTLNRQDRLFILDSSANKTAWFNIGADLDGRIRELWSEDED